MRRPLAQVELSTEEMESNVEYLPAIYLFIL